MTKNPSWKILAVGAWGIVWLLLAISFVVPGLSDNPAYDRWRYAIGGVFVVLTLLGFAANAWWANRGSLPLPWARGALGKAMPGKRAPGTARSTPPAPATPATATTPTDGAPRKKTGADLPTVLRDRPKTGTPPAPLKKPVAPLAAVPPVDAPISTSPTTAPVPTEPAVPPTAPANDA